MPATETVQRDVYRTVSYKAQGLRTRHRAWRGASALRAPLPRPQRTTRRAHARGAQQLVFCLLENGPFVSLLSSYYEYDTE